MRLTRILVSGFLVWSAQVSAQDWSYQAPDPATDGSPLFYAWTGGEGQPDGRRGNQLTLILDPNKSSLRPHGTCSASDCTVKVILNGRLPQPGQMISVRFSNGVHASWRHEDGVALTDNYTRAKISRMNGFYRAMRTSNWVEIGFGRDSHRFSLNGSNAAMDAIRPLLR
jgi:hypothetical protein